MGLTSFAARVCMRLVIHPFAVPWEPFSCLASIDSSGRRSYAALAYYEPLKQ